MASFTIRVELHSAAYTDYEKLHAAMARRGFARQITADDGTVYHLPTAEYERSGNFTQQQILDSAKAAAAETGKRFAVLVTEAQRRIWVGLQQVPSIGRMPSFGF